MDEQVETSSGHHPISPLEAMAKAAWDNNNPGSPWGSPEMNDYFDKAELLADMRAALLALADCQFSAEVRMAGANKLDLSDGLKDEIWVEMDDVFRAMLREVASPPTSGDRTALTP